MLDGVDADQSKTVYLDKCRYYQYRMVQMDMKMHHLDYQAAEHTGSDWSATQVTAECSDDVLNMLNDDINIDNKFAPCC